jgi:hypothetical protein
LKITQSPTIDDLRRMVDEEPNRAKGVAKVLLNGENYQLHRTLPFKELEASMPPHLVDLLRYFETTPITNVRVQDFPEYHRSRIYAFLRFASETTDRLKASGANLDELERANRSIIGEALEASGIDRERGQKITNEGVGALHDMIWASILTYGRPIANAVALRWQDVALFIKAVEEEVTENKYGSISRVLMRWQEAISAAVQVGMGIMADPIRTTTRLLTRISESGIVDDDGTSIVVAAGGPGEASVEGGGDCGDPECPIHGTEGLLSRLKAGNLSGMPLPGRPPKKRQDH